MALIDDTVNILKWSGKTALLGVGVVVGLRVLVPALLPHCRPLLKGAVEGFAVLLDRLQAGASAPSGHEKPAIKVISGTVVQPAAKAATGAASPPAARTKPQVVPPVRKKSAAAAPAKTKISKLRPYQQWSKAELYHRAKELNISGRSSMNKAELIKAIRAAGK